MGDKNSTAFTFEDGSFMKKSAIGESDDDLMNSSDDSSYDGVYEGQLPIIGLIKST
jgi:hypothetical protein